VLKLSAVKGRTWVRLGGPDIRQAEMADNGPSGLDGVGIKQVDLTNWYIGEVAATQGIADTKELLLELKLAGERIIALIHHFLSST